LEAPHSIQHIEPHYYVLSNGYLFNAILPSAALKNVVAPRGRRPADWASVLINFFQKKGAFMQRKRKVGRRRRRRFGNAVGIVNSRPRQRRRNSYAVDQRDAAVDASGDVADDQADGAADADFCG